MTEIHLGYELGTGQPVSIPLKHMAVTGQTQESGKTTTLEALIARGKLRAVAFVTKRAEGSFRSGRRIEPYFRERADWQFVAAILEATLRERLKFERSWIMRACKGAQTLAQVQANVELAMVSAKGLSADVYLTLNEYLKIVLPQLERLPYSDHLALEPGLNVVDLSPYSPELQALVITSTLEWVYEREQDTVTIIPEAWEFIPQNRSSPVLLAAERLIRKGAAAENFIWLDSQDIAGVHKNVLRQVVVWILGVQREDNEVRRMLRHVPNVPKPTAQQVMSLGLGQFYACWGKRVVPLYVQPTGVEAEQAIAAARSGEAARREAAPVASRSQQKRLALQRGLPMPTFEELSPPPQSPPAEEAEMSAEERAKYEAEIRDLKRQNAELETKARAGSPALEATIDQLEHRLGETQKELEAKRAQVESVKADFAKLAVKVAAGDRAVETLKALRQAYGSLLGVAGTASQVDVEAVVRAVLERLPQGGGVQVVVQAPEALRKEFQTREVERVLANLREKPARLRDAVRLLEGSGQWIGMKALGERLGVPTAGNSWMTFSKGLAELSDSGFIERQERQGVRGGLRRKLSTDLALYQPSEAELEQVYQTCLAALTEKAEADG